jgi:PAS domain S-box-containing protein
MARPKPHATTPQPTDVASLLDVVLEHVAYGIAMFDGERRLTMSNRRLLELLAISDAELSSVATLDTLIGFLAERGDFGPNPDAARKAVDEHLIDLHTPFTAERMLPDGRVLEFRRNPLADGSILVTFTDVTERRHNEFLLQDGTRELRAILEKAPVALCVVGQDDGLLKHANARFRRLFELSGPSVADALPLDRFLSAEDCGAILSSRNGRKPYDFETQARRTDGENFWTLVSTIPFVFDWQPATLTCFHDITTRRLAEAALKEELDRKRAELDEARTLQLQLAPPPFRGRVGRFDVSLDVLLDPAKEVGGDLVDHFELGENLRVLVLGDVSNKGAGAALVMARAHALFRAIAARPDAEALFRAPERVLALVNAALVKDNPSCMFLSLLLATFDGATGALTYARGGHIPPFLHRADGTMLRLGAARGMLLGLEEDALYASAVVALHPGDQLLIVTDGITEANSPIREMFGEPRVAAFLSSLAVGDEQPLAQLMAQVRKFEAGQPAFDDVAALFLELNP